MKKTISMLMLAGVLSLSTLTSTAMASLETEDGAIGLWAWDVDSTYGNIIAVQLSSAGGNGDSTFAFASGSSYLPLLTNTAFAFSTVTFTDSNTKATRTSSSLSNPEPPIDLVEETYTFAFKDGSAAYDEHYSWSHIKETTIYYITGVSGWTVQLNIAANVASASNSDPVIPSSVPVPGAAMLLGSGLLGLLSIRSRLNRNA